MVAFDWQGMTSYPYSTATSRLHGTDVELASRNKKVRVAHSKAERRVPELIPVLGSQPAGDVSHKPGDRLPLLSARPAVTLTTGLLPISLLGEQRHDGCEQFA